VDAVTVGTDRGEGGQAFVDERPAVDALIVFLVGPFIVDVIFNNYGHVIVASGAGQGDVPPVGQGLGIGYGEDIVLAVTVPAMGHILSPPLEIALAVDAVRIIQRAEARAVGFGLPMATGRAVDVRDVLRVGRLTLGPIHLDIVAIGAGQRGVNRRGQWRGLDGFFGRCGGSGTMASQAGGLDLAASVLGLEQERTDGQQDDG
jgi:hypothetical protein